MRRYVVARAFLSCAAVIFSILSVLAIASHAQGPARPTIKLLANDQTPLPLSGNFGVPSQADVNQAGDYVFTGTGASALFYKSAASPSAIRLLQRNDAVPGIPGVHSDLFQPFRLNNSGRLAVQVSFFSADPTQNGNAILLYDGSFHTVVKSSDPVPGVAGTLFGTVGLVGLNDAGDIAFVAPLRNASTGANLNQNTLYIIPAGGSPVRIIAVNDAAPGITGFTLGSLQATSLNNAGQVLFNANLTGATGSFAWFLGSTTGVQKVVAGGDPVPSPGSGTFPTGFGTTLLNNSGQVAFGPVANGFWLFTPGTGITKLAFVGDAIPAPPTDLGGTIGVLRNLLAFNDSGAAAIVTSISGNAGNGNVNYNNVLFRFSSGTLQSVAYSSQTPPGTSGTFGGFDSASMNAGGQISFRGNINGGTTFSGIFKQSPAGPLTAVALSGDTAPIGGTYRIFNSRTRTLNNGSIYYTSDLDGGSADYWEFLTVNGSFTTLMTTADVLPVDSLVSMRVFDVGTAGDYAMIFARKNAGPATVFQVRISTGAITRVAGDGDLSPDALGHFRNIALNGIAVNASGQAALFPFMVGIGGGGVYLWTPGSGLAKVAAPGDIESVTSAMINGVTTYSGYGGAPLNNAGQVVFQANLSNGTNAILVGSVGSAPTKVVAIGDPSPNGGTFQGFNTPSNMIINASGQVAFSANNNFGSRGIFVGSPGGTPVKIVSVGDAGPSGSTFSNLPSAYSFNNSGELFFSAFLNGSTGAGYFKGTTSGSPQAIALNNDPAPGGGNFSINGSFTDGLINDQHDIVFRAGLSNTSSDSGIFLRRGGGGALQSVARQGQPAIGTAGTLATLPSGINNIAGEFLSLQPSGELFLRVNIQSSWFLSGWYRFRTSDLLERVVVQGDAAPGISGEVIAAPGVHAWSVANPVLEMVVAGGSAHDAIYAVESVAADLSLTPFGPGDTDAGAPATYTYVVTNQGPFTATDVTLTVPIPANATVSDASGCTVTTAVICNLGSIAVGGSANVSVSYIATSGPTLNFTNISVNATEPDPDGSNNSTGFLTNVHLASLGIAMFAQPTGVVTGNPMSFNIVVGNDSAPGTATAYNVVLNDPLPAGPGLNWFIDLPYTGPGTCAVTGPPGSQVLHCSMGNLAPGGSTMVHVLTQTGFSSAGNYTNTATVSANFAAPQTTSVSVPVMAPVLSVTKTADANSVAAGSNIGFTITARNSGAGGTGAAFNVMIHDLLPAQPGVTWSISPAYGGPGSCSLAGQTLNCAVGDLFPGQSATVHMTGATTYASSGTISNTATVTANNSPSRSASASTTVQAAPPWTDISVSVAGPPTVVQGQNATFVTTVSNNGPLGTTVTVTENLPPTLTLLSAGFVNNSTGTPGACGFVGLQITCAVGNLPYSGTPTTATITVVASTSQLGFYTLTAGANGGLPDGIPSNNSGKGTALVSLTPNAAETLINVDNGLGTIHLYDPATLTEITSAPPAFGVGMRIRPLTLPNGRIAFLRGPSYISVVDLSIKSEIYRIPIFPVANPALTADGTILVVPLTEQVALVNTATFQVTATIPLNGLVGDDPALNDISLASTVVVGSNAYFNPSGLKAGSTTLGLPIIVVNLNTLAVSTIAINGGRGQLTGGGMQERPNLAATPDGHYLAVSRQDRFVIIDLTSNTIVSESTSPSLINRDVAIVRDHGNPNVFAYLITPDIPATTVIDVRTGSPTFGQVIASGGDFPVDTGNGNVAPVVSGDGNTLFTFDFFFTIFKTNVNTLALTSNFIAMDENSYNLAIVDLTPVAGAPSIASVQPRAMLSDAPATVIVNGSNFAPDARVRFGWNAPLPATFLSSSQLQVTIPPGLPSRDNMDVVVTNPNSGGSMLQQNASGVLRGAFSILAPAAWQPAHPLVGVNTGDTTISVIHRSPRSAVIPQNLLTSAGVGLFGATSEVSADGTYAFIGITNIWSLTGNNVGVMIANLSTGQQTFTPLAGGGFSQMVRSVDPQTSASVLYVADQDPANNYNPRLVSIDANPASPTFGGIRSTIPAGMKGFVRTLTVSPNGRWVYVNVINAPAPARRILIFDTLTGARVGSMDTAALGIANNVSCMAVTPDGSSLIVQMASTNNIGVFDLTGNPAAPTLVTTIGGTVPAGKTNVSLDTYVVRGNQLFATGVASNVVPGNPSVNQGVVEVFNFNRGTSNYAPIVAYILPVLPTFGSGLVFSGDGSQLYAVSNSDSQILVLDTAKVLANDPTALLARVGTNFGPAHYALSSAPPLGGLALATSAMPNQVLIGSNVNLNFTLQNNSPVPATNILLQDTLPGGMTLVSASCTGGACACAGGASVSCFVSSLGSGQSISGTIVATAPAAPGPVTNSATAIASNLPSAGASSSFTVVAPNLSFVKTADIDTVNAGTAIGFTLFVSNASAPGTGVATGVTISDPLPAGPGLSWTINPAYNGPGSCSITGAPGNQTLNCALADLFPGGGASVRVVSPTSAASAGTYSNMATASSTDSPTIQASASVTVQAPVLSIAKAADATSVSAGTPIGFTITVNNSSSPGIGTAAGVVISDPLPAGPGVTWTISPAYSGPGSCAISGVPGGQVLNCSIGSLAPNGSGSVHVSGTTSFVSAGNYTNTATASASNAAVVTATASTTVRAPALAITNSADAAAVSAGSAIGFTVGVSNSAAAGTDTATSVVLSAPLPPGPGLAWSISPAYGGPGSCSIVGPAGNQSLSCALGNLAPGASTSVHVTSPTSFNSARVYSFTATSGASNIPPLTASASTAVQAPALTLTNLADSPAVSAGTAFGFNITVTNSNALGTGTATGVSINNPLPAGAGVQWSISPAYNGPGTCQISGDPGNQTLSCSVGTLAPGGNAHVHVVSPSSFATASVYASIAAVSASNAPTSYASATIAVQAPALNVIHYPDASAISTSVPIGFTILVNNNASPGTGMAMGVTINNPLPAGAGMNWSISPAYSGPGTCFIGGAAGSQVLTCTLGNLAPGDGAGVHITSVTTIASAGSYTSVAAVSAANAPTTSTAATTLVQAPAISVSNVADAGVVSTGAAVGFTVTVRNNAVVGAGTAFVVTVSDPLPNIPGVTWTISPAYGGLGVCAITGATGSQVLNCTIASLVPGASASVHVAGTTGTSSAGSYVSVATAAANNAPAVASPATIAVLAPALTVRNTPDAPAVIAGMSVGSTLTVLNSGADGTGTASSVTMSAALPNGPGLSWTINPAYSGPGICSISGAVGSQTLNCAFGNLAPGVTASVRVASLTTGSSVGTYNVTATVSAGNAASTNAPASITVQPPAPMSLLPSPVAFGSQLIYTGRTIAVTLTNGSVPMTIDSISISGNFTQSNNCPTFLAGGANCSIIVWFQPITLGVQGGALSIYYNGNPAPLQAAVSGTSVDQLIGLSRPARPLLSNADLGSGGQSFLAEQATTTQPGAQRPTRIAVTSMLPALASSQSLVEFGASQTGSVTISNTQMLPAKISGIEISGDFVQESDCGVQLEAGASCEIKLRFQPSAAGKRTGDLKVVTNLGSTAVRLVAEGQ